MRIRKYICFYHIHLPGQYQNRLSYPPQSSHPHPAKRDTIFIINPYNLSHAYQEFL